MPTSERKTIGISVAEAAAEAGVSESTIYSMFHAGQLPFARRLGHRIILHRGRFTEWLAGEAQAQSPAPDRMLAEAGQAKAAGS
jgi:excisionase family DNA binding protein